MSAPRESSGRHGANHDVKKARRDLYSGRAGRFDLVEVPPVCVLAADGEGDPNSAADYRVVVQTLYTLSYGVRALARSELGLVHTVAPLEGLWYAHDSRVFIARDKDSWRWTMMIVQPEWITAEMVRTAAERTTTRSHVDAERVRFAEFSEGLSVQTLHVGPYDDEGPTIARMHRDEIPERGLVPTGHHHEIYLSDPRRTAPEKLRTILRQPVARKGEPLHESSQ